jgi:hypothetical protein
MFPHYQNHVVTKAETCLVEAKNSSLRDMLARLNRRTKRYSKSVTMLRYSVWLWMKKEWALANIIANANFLPRSERHLLYFREWRTREDSNLRPTDSESVTLSN